MAESGPRFSIKRRLLVTLLATVAVVWLSTVVQIYRDAQRRIDELLDAHLAQSAALVAAQSGGEIEDEMDIEHLPYPYPYNRQVVFQVWEHGQRLRLRSAHAPAERLSAQEQGFSDAVLDGSRWRVFSAWAGAGEFLVQVGERRAVRDQMVQALIKHLLKPLALALPVLALLLWVGVTRGLRPLTALGEQIQQRDPDNLSLLEVSGAPVEVAPLAESLNRLFERVRASLDNERRFTADAAHELRTPLAGLMAQAQVARAATLDAERRHALEQVIEGCRRAAHLIEQMLTLARLDPERIVAPSRTCDLRRVATKAVAELAPLALAKDIALELSAGDPVEVVGNAELLRVLLRNLIDNAIRYSPAGTAVRIDITRTAAGLGELIVTDQGPGITPAEREKVGQRFYRILGSGETGSGLGLSIVKRIAELHHARVALSGGEQEQGLRVRVTF